MAGRGRPVNLGISADVPFGNKDSFDDFLLQNEIAHISYGSNLARQKGIVISAILPVGNPIDHNDWLNDHWRRHAEECQTLGIAVPDLSVVDLKDETQYLDWMMLHAQLHQQQNQKLGIKT